MWVLLSSLVAAAPDTDALDRVLSQAADRGDLIGAVQVVDGDNVLLQQTYGPAPDDLVCRVGSITKSFTAAAIYALADEGRLSLDDRIGTLLPEVGDQLGEPGPTLRQLATHHGGLSEPGFNPWIPPPPDWETFARLALPQLTVEAPAGERERYSNFGFTLLAAAASRAAGEPFESVLTSRLFAPLGLKDTGITRVPDIDARMLRGRVRTPLGLIDVQRALPRLIPYDFRWPIGGAGSMTSTPSDLVRWAEGLREGRILSADSRAALLTPADGSNTAAGWVVEDGGRVWHNGALEPLGIYAYLRWSPDNEQVVAFCSTPGVSDTSPEWRATIEAALAGEAPPEVTVSVGAIGWVALASWLKLHWLLGLYGLAQAARGGKKRRDRIAAGLSGAGAALVSFGLSHVALGLTAAAACAVLCARRLRDAPEGGRVISVVSGAIGLTVGVLVAAGFAGFSLLVENIWSFGG